VQSIQIIGPTTPRFRTPAELREAGLSRRSPRDTINDVIRLKADANIAMAEIDKALNRRRRADDYELSWRAQSTQPHGYAIVDNGEAAGIEWRTCGQILSVR
jgi:hypothetical protein